MVLVLKSLVDQAAWTPGPGAETSVHSPKLEKLERASPCGMELTAYAPVADAGEKLHALALEFPEATTPATLTRLEEAPPTASLARQKCRA